MEGRLTRSSLGSSADSGMTENQRGKNTRTKLTALARSIDLKGGWTDFHRKNNINQGLGKNAGFITPPIGQSVANKCPSKFGDKDPTFQKNAACTK